MQFLMISAGIVGGDNYNISNIKFYCIISVDLNLAIWVYFHTYGGRNMLLFPSLYLKHYR